MAIGDKIISFWKQVKIKSSDMFTLFKVGVGIKIPTHKLHVKDKTDPMKLEGVQSDTSSSTKFLVLDGSDVIKHTTGSGKTTEEVQDIVGAMFTGNTETGIAATYEDSDGTIDLVVSGPTDLHSAGVDGAANQLLTDDGDGTVTSESELTYDNSSEILQIGSNTFNTVSIIRQAHTDDIGGKIDIEGGDSGGTNKAGGDVRIYGGKGTGNAAGGAIEFYVSTAGSSGDTSHLVQAVDMTITDGQVAVNGNITVTGTVDGIDIATDVAANTAKTSFPGFGTSGGTALEGNTTIPVDLTTDGTGTIHANNVPTLNQDTTGNAATATNLTTGDKTLAGIITSKGYIVDGDRNGSGNGVAIHVDAMDITDSTTSASGTALTYNHVSFENPRVFATNSNVTTTTASTVFIKGAPVASTNQTFTNSFALFIGGGNSYFAGDIIVAGNDIKDSGGSAAITFDGSANTTVTGNLNVTGTTTGKQYQVFPTNFIDDIGTSEVFLPIHGTTFEQSLVYQDDVALVAPCDGRVVSVTLSIMSVTGTSDVNVRVYSRAPDNSGTSLANWTLEETEEVNITSTDDSHVVHFGFSNAKHFESTEKFAISIQADSDIMGNTFIYATTVIEWDYSTLLGASAKYDSVP
tara:strand:+ start:1808 stop:3703 length:1896 start_codon:yes stop_codon:yes gene_type:complete